MNKEDLKKSVITGIVTGFVGALTGVLCLYAYVEFSKWYDRYCDSKPGSRDNITHCERPELKGHLNNKDSIDIPEISNQ